MFDDYGSIIGNQSIRQLWPADWLRPPATAGETVSGRPVLNATFALNHAIGGLRVGSYHAANLLIHLAAALALWGILRRTPVAGGPGVALAASLIWAVHPLQTAAVTYVVQRAESLAALFGLLTLYCFTRGATGAARRWYIFAVIACLLGVGTKETVAVVPLLVLLYDRAFLAGSFRAAWRARGRVHAALFATWLPLAALVWINRGRGGSVGNATIGAVDYFLTQCGAVVRYLGLAFWPAGQVFDYGTPVVTNLAAVAPQFLLLVLLAGGVGWLVSRNHPAGFAGASFFLLLAPSSSFVPVATQTLAEHRMYLPLAPLVVLLCVAWRRWAVGGRVAVAATAFVVVALGATAFARNHTYASELSLWGDTAAKRPDNPRARYNHGLALASAGRGEEAQSEFLAAVALQPNHAFAWFELGKAAMFARRWPEAAEYLTKAVAIDPEFTDARVNAAQALAAIGRHEEAIAHYRGALARQPESAEINALLATVLRARGQVLASRGEPAGAEAAWRESVALDDQAATWFALGNLLARSQRFDAAVAAYESALARDPGHLEARSNLGNSLLFLGRYDAAIVQYEAVLQARPGDSRTRENLRLAREAKARGP